MNDNYAIFSKPDDIKFKKNKKNREFKERFNGTKSEHKGKLETLIKNIIETNPDIDFESLIIKLKENNNIFIAEIGISGNYVFIPLSKGYTYDHSNNILKHESDEYEFRGLGNDGGFYKANFTLKDDSAKTSNSLKDIIENDFSVWIDFIEFLSDADCIEILKKKFIRDAISNSDDLIAYIEDSDLINIIEVFADVCNEDDAKKYFDALSNYANNTKNNNITCNNPKIRNYHPIHD